MKNFTEYFSGLNYAISKLNHADLEEAYMITRSCRNLYIFGNGGSAAIANHWVCDFMKGINEDTIRKATAISLNSNIDLITAIANDIGYAHIFSKQLDYMRPTPDDAVIAISSSGNSSNILNGIDKANELGLTTIAMTGFDGGRASRMADCSVHVPVHNYGMVEDLHMMILHAISQRIRVETAKSLDDIRL